MAAIAASLIARLVVSLTISGNRLSLTFHYFAGSPIVGRELDELCDEFETNVLPSLQGVVTTEVKFESIVAHCVAPDTALPGTNYLSGVVGSAVGESLPSNVGAVVQLRQVEVSSKHNGRVIIPGLPEDACVDNLLDPTFVSSDLGAVVTALGLTLTTSANTFKLCVVKRFDAGAPVTPVGYAVTTVRPVRNMGTQRRRTTELREFHP